MHPISAKIDALQRKLVLRRRCAAGCSIAATSLAAAIVLGLFDYVVRPADVGLRIMATFALVGAMMWAAFRWWYRPRRRRVAPLAIARSIESRFPQLQDSLSSAVEFLRQADDDDTAGSAQLRRRVVVQAATAIEDVSLDEVIDRRPLRRAVQWLAAACVALAACLAWDARAVGTAAMRLAGPLGSIQWPRHNYLAFRDIPARMAVGQAFEVEVMDTSGSLPDDVRVHYRFNVSGHRQSVTETPVRSGNLAIARRDDVHRSFAVRATGGDDDTMRWHVVEVVEPPQLESVSLTVLPPPYTGLPAQSVNKHFDIVEGSQIVLSGQASVPLRSAKILRPDSTAIRAVMVGGPAESKHRQFQLAPGQWVPTASGTYSLELADEEGLAGIATEWRIQVQPDTPPTVTWRHPTEDIFVTSSAVVPLDFAVEDNLAVQHVGMVYDRFDRGDAASNASSNSAKIDLYRGPDVAVSGSASVDAMRGEKRRDEYKWDIAAMQLPVGGQLVVHGEATDYRPGTGHTAGPRRITIIGSDELETRLADRQSAIVRQLERARDAQRGVSAQLQPLGARQLAHADLADSHNELQLAELAQRRVTRMLADPADGVPAIVDTVIAEIEMNRLTTAPLRPLLERLRSDLLQLAAGPLDVAERELTAAAKISSDAAATRVAASDSAAAASDTSQVERLTKSIAAASAAQQQAIETIENWIHNLSGRVGHARLLQQLTELRQIQAAHEQATRVDIGLDTLPLQFNELSRAQRTQLDAAAAGQEQIAARFRAIAQQMEALVAQPADESDGDAGPVAAAMRLAQQLDIQRAMQQTAQDLHDNRVGQALAQELRLVADLQRVIDLLRQLGEPKPGQRTANLQAAQQRLNQLRSELAVLRQQIADFEPEPKTASSVQWAADLTQQQESLRQEMQQLSQALEQLAAPDASQSVRSAADRMASSSNKGSDAGQQRRQPSTSANVRRAEQDLEQAARQLAEHRQQAELDLALEFVRRFQAELTQMVERQRNVITETTELHAKLPTDDVSVGSIDVKKVDALAAQERELAQMAREHGELLFGLTAVRIGLEEARRRLSTAADRLAEHDVGPSTQAAEEHALTRLEGMLMAFAQTASESGQAPPSAASPASSASPPPQRRPTFELLEVKMLRMLQIDLNDRTRDFQKRLSDAGSPDVKRRQAELVREAAELQAEQARLAELVEQMLTRNNEQQE